MQRQRYWMLRSRCQRPSDVPRNPMILGNVAGRLVLLVGFPARLHPKQIHASRARRSECARYTFKCPPTRRKRRGGQMRWLGTRLRRVSSMLEHDQLWTTVHRPRKEGACADANQCCRESRAMYQLYRPCPPRLRLLSLSVTHDYVRILPCLHSLRAHPARRGALHLSLIHI